MSPERSPDALETVLSVTGRRPSAPGDLTARVEARVLAHWQAEVRARRRRLQLRSFAAVAIVAAGVTAWWVPRATTPPAAAARPAATVALVTESWWQASGASTAQALRQGDTISAGSRVATEDRGGTALRLTGGQSLRLDAGTRVTLISERVVALERGAVYVDSQGTATIEIQTPLGVVRDIGTQFEVREQQQQLTVRVREGRVMVDTGSARVDVGAGHQLLLSPTGEISRQSALGANDFQWLERLTPMIEIDGRALLSFLEWAARERGLRLEFASASGRLAAQRIVLSGSVQGMTIDEALEATLATSQMAAAVADGALRIGPARESGRRR